MLLDKSSVCLCVYWYVMITIRKEKSDKRLFARSESAHTHAEQLCSDEWAKKGVDVEAAGL